MHGTSQPAGTLARADLDLLLAALRAEGREVIGPVARDGAIVYAPIEAAAELPAGLLDEQEAGHYRLRPTESARVFDHTCGPSSAKRFLYPPEVTLFRARKVGERLRFEEERAAPPRALVGLRACDLAALAVHDRVLRDGPYANPHYATRRRDLLVVAVQCGRAGATCFCASMSGARLAGSFDLGLTELDDEGGHRFVVEVGSAAGAALARALPLTPIDEADAAAPARAAAEAEAQQVRRLPTEGLPERLLAARDLRHWQEVASRCLGCANCTSVCPTCFCTDVADVTDLDGGARRERRWDSCFHPDFTAMHGQPMRGSLAARYRHWITHKLATWHSQFGTSGCVGCGRCITWCPVGIDLVAEATRAAGLEAAT